MAKGASAAATTAKPKPKTKSKPTMEKASTSKAIVKVKELPSTLHPPYFQMISEAICALKERTGSSQQAIAKFIEEKYPNGLPPNFKKLLSVQLKRFTKSERLVKVKHSFKISPTEKVKMGSEKTMMKKKKPEKKEQEEAKPVPAKAKKPEKKEKGVTKTVTEKAKKTAPPAAAKAKAKSVGLKAAPAVSKSKSVAKPRNSAIKGGKNKRLSQVKTPDRLKKVLSPKKKTLKPKPKPVVKKTRV